MTIQDAITKAVEGGWKWGDWPMDGAYVKERADVGLWLYKKGGSQLTPLDINRILLDPLFWQALGKAMGWGKCGSFQHSWDCPDNRWIEQQHALISHLQDGGSIESFFATL